ncbi:hypothetical protein P9112_012398 [Eukaryota sp. TZLM1-RC]
MSFPNVSLNYSSEDEPQTNYDELIAEDHDIPSAKDTESPLATPKMSTPMSPPPVTNNQSKSPSFDLPGNLKLFHPFTDSPSLSSLLHPPVSYFTPLFNDSAHFKEFPNDAPLCLKFKLAKVIDVAHPSNLVVTNVYISAFIVNDLSQNKELLSNVHTIKGHLEQKKNKFVWIFDQSNQGLIIISVPKRFTEFSVVFQLHMDCYSSKKSDSDLVSVSCGSLIMPINQSTNLNQFCQSKSFKINDPVSHDHIPSINMVITIPKKSTLIWSWSMFSCVVSNRNCFRFYSNFIELIKYLFNKEKLENPFVLDVFKQPTIRFIYTVVPFICSISRLCNLFVAKYFEIIDSKTIKNSEDFEIQYSIINKLAVTVLPLLESNHLPEDDVIRSLLSNYDHPERNSFDFTNELISPGGVPSILFD